MQVTQMTWNGFVWTDHVLTDDEVVELKERWQRQWEFGGPSFVLPPPAVWFSMELEIEMSSEMAATIQEAFATRFTRTLPQTIERLDRAIANVRRFV